MIIIHMPEDGSGPKHQCVYGAVTANTADPFEGGILVMPPEIPVDNGDCDYPEFHTEEFTDALLQALMRALPPESKP